MNLPFFANRYSLEGGSIVVTAYLFKSKVSMAFKRKSTANKSYIHNTLRLKSWLQYWYTSSGSSKGAFKTCLVGLFGFLHRYASVDQAGGQMLKEIVVPYSKCLASATILVLLVQPH